ncbi:MAG: hypothetical protein CUN55_01440 [Phototrophicales bacterium]|nr:MAG: hypothetical protein CUN55_01440 [Phototrophicales bacterium]
MHLSRRDFLKLIGVSISSAWVYGIGFDDILPLSMGRLFAPTHLRQFPNEHSPSIKLLWPDSTHPILNIAGDWIRIQEGYIPKTAIQPMFAPTEPSPTTIEHPIWVEVVAPSVALHSYADADAPIRFNIGHGGLLYIEHSLCNDHGQWWLRSTQGWLQASCVQIINLPHGKADFDIELIISPQQNNIHVIYGNHTIVLEACFPKTPIQGQTLQLCPLNSKHLWAMKLGDKTSLYGTFEHNTFSKLRTSPDHCVELSAVAARWLYYQALRAQNIKIELLT